LQVDDDSEPRLETMLRGSSPAMHGARQLLSRIAVSPASTVLITGESGTGKDLAARALHQLGATRQHSFVNITCSALPDTLLETELFGHERGAFTDAHQRKKGLLEEASGGTVFLDEVGEMAPALQAKLLRFLEERAFRRVGGLSDVRADVRVIAATHRNLSAELKSGAFRRDLYYRLAVLHIQLPPLRHRMEDVPELATHFVATLARAYGKPIVGLSPPALDKLQRHSWPGNVRELRNVIERAVLLSDRETQLAAHNVTLVEAEAGESLHKLPAGGINLAQLERDLVMQALERATGNKSRAAALLGLSRDQMRRRIDKLALGAESDCAKSPDAG
jgi:two-component system response regulator AtoC